MTLARFQALVKELGERVGAPDLASDDEGYTGLEVDGLAVHLQHEPDDDLVMVFARLGEVEEIRAEQIYGYLLAANLFWQGTKGATLSLEPATNIVFIADRRPMEGLRLDSLLPWLDRFADVAGYWRRRLAEVNAGRPLDESGGEEDGGPDSPPGGGGGGGGGGPQRPFLSRG